MRRLPTLRVAGVIQEAPGTSAELASLLESQREALRAFEGTALAQTAEALTEIVERLARLYEKVQRPLSEDWYPIERAAIEMGYVDEEGEPKKDAFSRAMKAAGVPRADLAQTHIYYHREDLDRMLRTLRR